MIARHYFFHRWLCFPDAKLLVFLVFAIVGCGKESEGASTTASPTSPPPNIVILMADDLGMGDLSYLGGQPQTPHIDQLAAGGLRLDNFHAYPVCSPSRAALLTGKSPLRLGLAWTPLPPWSDRGLPEGVPTIADLLKAQNYFTAIVGKWHLGHSAAGQHPNRRGFEHFYGCITGSVDYWTHRGRRGGLDWQRNGESVLEQGYATDLLALEAKRLIQKHDFARPMFLYVPFTAPHQPLQAPKGQYPEYEKINDPARHTYCVMVTEMDRAIGEIIRSLKERGQYQNTLIVFLSDNGGAKDQGANNSTYRGGKGSVFEGGIKVPALLHWPARLPAGGCSSEFTSLLDLAPTIEAAALPSKSEIEWDGRNLLPLLSDATPPSQVEWSTAFVALNSDRVQMALFQSEWKYVRRLDNKKVNKEWLFHLSEDKEEKNNLASSEPERVDRMRAELLKWLELDPLGPRLNEVPISKEDEPKGWTPPADWASL